MPEQLALEGFEAPRPPTDRLFFALQPDAAAVECIERLLQTLRPLHRLTGKPLGRQRWHVTLHHVGDFAGLPQGLVDVMVQAAQAATAGAPFPLAFDRAASFARKGRDMPLVLLGDAGVLALKVFQQTLQAAVTPPALQQARGAHYLPHLTLLYDDRRVADQPVEPIGWSAREFVLVRSLIGRSRHDVLERFALRG